MKLLQFQVVDHFFGLLIRVPGIVVGSWHAAKSAGVIPKLAADHFFN